MDRNERSVDFPAEVMSDLRELVTPFALRAYPEPSQLYQKLAEWLHSPQEQLLVTMAADGGLRSVFDTFVEPGDEVVHVAPSYGMYPVYCGIAGAVSRPVQFDEDLCLPLPRILKEINPKTRLVVLTNPNQPIERLYSEAELKTLLESCLGAQAILVVDEAYHHFCPTTAAPWVAEYGNLIVVRTFSKAFGMAGIRLGYLISHPENIRHLEKVRPMYEAHSLAIAFGLYLLEHDHLMISYVAEVRKSVQVLVEAMGELHLKAYGRWTNSVLVALPPELPAVEVAHDMKARGFLIRAESEFPLSNHLRITVGSVNQVKRFVRAFESLLLDWKVQVSR